MFPFGDADVADRQHRAVVVGTSCHATGTSCHATGGAISFPMHYPFAASAGIPFPTPPYSAATPPYSAATSAGIPFQTPYPAAYRTGSASTISTRAPSSFGWPHTPVSCPATGVSHHMLSTRTFVEHMDMRAVRGSLHATLGPEGPTPASMKRRYMPRLTAPVLSGVGGLDICFVMDCTASMGPWIEASKQTIKDMIAALPADEPHKRVAFVGYRDFGDGPAQVHPFTEDVNDVVGFIDRQAAIGGDDIPEDVAGGLVSALDLEWISQTRTLVLIADAPCHGQKYQQYGGGDDYPQGDPTGLSMTALLRGFRTSHIDFTFVQLTSETDKMQGLLKVIYDTAAGAENINKFELRDLREIIEEAGGVAAIGDGRAPLMSTMLSAAVTPTITSSYVQQQTGMQTISPPVSHTFAASMADVSTLGCRPYSSAPATVA